MIKVILQNRSEATVKQDNLSGGDLLLSRATYQTLGSLIGNREIATRNQDGSYTIHYEKLTEEYTTFLEDMNNLWIHTYYPDLAILNNIPEPTDAVKVADEYLGDLGIIRNYSYSKDTVNIGSWLDVESQASMRVLMDESDNTYLTDVDEVLVVYT